MSPLRRVGLLGDLHGEDRFLRAALDTFAREGVDAVLAVGDLVDGHGDVEAALTLLREAGVTAVRGNHDRWLLAGTNGALPDATPRDALSDASWAFVAALPRTVRLETAMGPALLCHGLGTNDMAQLGFDDQGYALASNEALQDLLADDHLRVVLHGHSHRPGVRALGQIAFVNAGTLAREHEPCFAIVDFVERTATYFDLLVGPRAVLGSVLRLDTTARK